MLAPAIVFIVAVAVVLIVGRLSETGHIPYKYGAPFEFALERLPAFLLFGGIVFAIASFLLWDGSPIGSDCFIDWDGRSNPLSC